MSPDRNLHSMRTKIRTMIFLAVVFAAAVFSQHAAAQTSTFSLQADPPSVEVAPGHSGFVTISTQDLSGDGETISFGASGAPAHVTLTVQPPAVQAGSSTPRTIAADSSAVLGSTATIPVSGMSGDESETT